mgnify:CR=1 FL=1
MLENDLILLTESKAPTFNRPSNEALTKRNLRSRSYIELFLIDFKILMFSSRDQVRSVICVEFS